MPYTFLKCSDFAFSGAQKFSILYFHVFSPTKKFHLHKKNPAASRPKIYPPAPSGREDEFQFTMPLPVAF